jgi:hypothetical protein
MNGKCEAILQRLFARNERHIERCLRHLAVRIGQGAEMGGAHLHGRQSKLAAKDQRERQRIALMQHRGLLSLRSHLQIFIRFACCHDALNANASRRPAIQQASGKHQPHQKSSNHIQPTDLCLVAKHIEDKGRSKKPSTA